MGCAPSKDPGKDKHTIAKVDEPKQEEAKEQNPEPNEGIARDIIEEENAEDASKRSKSKIQPEEEDKSAIKENAKEAVQIERNAGAAMEENSEEEKDPNSQIKESVLKPRTEDQPPAENPEKFGMIDSNIVESAIVNDPAAVRNGKDIADLRKEPNAEVIKEEPEEEVSHDDSLPKSSVKNPRDPVPQIFENKIEETEDLAENLKDSLVRESNVRYSEFMQPSCASMDSFRCVSKSPELKNGVSSILEQYQAEDAEGAQEMDAQMAEYYAQVQQLHKDFEKVIGDPRWELCDKGENWAGYTMLLDEVICSKSVGKIKGAPIEIFAYTSSEKYVKDYNEIIQELVVLEKLPQNMRLVRMINNGSLMISARDYLMVNHVTMDAATGILETVSGSVENSEYPPESEFVRGETKLLGTRLMPTTNNETDVITISMIDLKGKIPVDLKTRAGEQQATRIMMVEKAFKKRFTE